MTNKAAEYPLDELSLREGFRRNGRRDGGGIKMTSFSLMLMVLSGVRFGVEVILGRICC